MRRGEKLLMNLKPMKNFSQVYMIVLILPFIISNKVLQNGCNLKEKKLFQRTSAVFSIN